jgi:hypothetical protein
MRKVSSLILHMMRRLFGDLNCDILGPPDDGNITILNDSDKEEEVCEDDAAAAEATPSFATGIPASTASAADTDEDLTGMKDDNSDDLTPLPHQEIGDDRSGGDKAGSP